MLSYFKKTLLIATLISAPITLLIVSLIKKIEKKGFNYIIIAIHLLLTFISGSSLGWLSLVGINVYAILALAGSSVPLASMLMKSYRKQKKLIAEYRKKEQYLIEP